jgi:Na+-driven multidrug efflux pump
MTWLFRLPKVLRLPVACVVVILGCFALALFVAMLPAILLIRSLRNSWRIRRVVRATEKARQHD